MSRRSCPVCRGHGWRWQLADSRKGRGRISGSRHIVWATTIQLWWLLRAPCACESGDRWGRQGTTWPGDRDDEIDAWLASWPNNRTAVVLARWGRRSEPFSDTGLEALLASK